MWGPGQVAAAPGRPCTARSRSREAQRWLCGNNGSLCKLAWLCRATRCLPHMKLIIVPSPAFLFLPFTGCPARCQPDMSLSPGTPATIQHKYKEKSLTLPSCDRTCVLLPMFVCLFALTAICSTVRRRDTLCLLFPSLGVFGTNNNKHNLCARLIRMFFVF